MTEFLIKSAIGLALLLGLYHLLLEKEKMHRFNRFYLLLSLVFSLALPLISITIPVYVKPRPAASKMVMVPVAPENEAAHNPQAVTANPAPVSTATEINYWPYIGWGAYALITVALIGRFSMNIYQFYRLKKSNITVRHKGATLVLLNENILPYTFLGNIFINLEDYENRSIEPELFTHELTHVRQRHSFDILFIELLRILFWFNPLLFLYKKAIQLNHEFLADESTINQHPSIPAYQNLLLGKSGPATVFSLASSINFGITKKRFIMMTKTTSTAKSIVLKLAILPVASTLVYCLGTQTVVHAASAANNTPNNPIALSAGTEELIPDISNNGPSTENIPQRVKDTLTDEQRRDAYYSGVRIIYIDERDGTAINKPYEELTREQRQKYTMAPRAAKAMKLSNEEFERIKRESDVVNVNRKEVTKAELSKYKAGDFVYYMGSSVLDGTFTETTEYNLYTMKFFEENIKYPDIHYGSDTLKIDIGREGIPNGHVVRTFTPEEGRKYMEEEYVYLSGLTNPQPEYPGGLKAFHKTISDNFKAPAGITGKVNFSIDFIVERDGSVSSLEIKSDEDINDAVYKAVAATAKWKPGIINEKPVRVRYSLPVILQVK